MTTSDTGRASPSPWKIRNLGELLAWVWHGSTSDEDGVAVLEFIDQRVCEEPDFGEVIDVHTRGEVAPGSAVEVIWTFNPEKMYIDIITPAPPE
ncbi:MAG: hypothetical protein H0X05_02810 [Actinobacteria bacterium]|nr:hypothetical protein [Actinomycetota bacterium]